MQNGAETLKNAWNVSYNKLQNTLFYPSEGVVAFVNKNIRRRTGPNEFDRPFAKKPVVVDLGSGAGRHLKFLWENGYYPIGIELSDVACRQAIELMRTSGADENDYSIHCCDSSASPVLDSSADYVISTATFDSMTLDQAKGSVAEVARILKSGGLFYVDLISDQSSRFGKRLSEHEFLVDEDHERGTVQLFYTANLIDSVFSAFTVNSMRLAQILDREGKVLSARWSCVMQK